MAEEPEDTLTILSRMMGEQVELSRSLVDGAKETDEKLNALSRAVAEMGRRWDEKFDGLDYHIAQLQQFMERRMDDIAERVGLPISKARN